MTPLEGVDLFALAQYGERRGTRILADAAEARLVLFSLKTGQKVSGRGEPRVHLLALDGEGELWAGDERVPATAGTLIACDAGTPHGAQAGDGRFLVLGIITPGPAAS